MHFAMMSGVPAPYNSLSNPLENPRDGRAGRRGIRDKLRFLPWANRLRRRASGSDALAAARQSRVSRANANGSVGSLDVLDHR